MVWTTQETTTHQDHVIAHVIGATVFGSFVFDESIYVLLDIGFLWRVYLDGEMGLLPTSVTIEELDAEVEIKEQLKIDCDRLSHQAVGEAGDLKQMTRAPSECAIDDVTLQRNGEDWRLLLHGEQNTLGIQASMSVRIIELLQL